MSQKRSFDSVDNPSKGSEPTAKRKFVPNLKNAINKTVASNKPSKQPVNGEANHATRGGRGGVRRQTDRDKGPKYVQSYSIFEAGIGCVTKSERNAVELREARTSSSSVTKKAAVTQEADEVEFKDDLLEQCQSFVTDIKQVFKDPPILMQDSAAGMQSPVDPLRTMDLSEGRNHQVPYDFFTDSGSGRLFSLQLPDKLLPSDLEEVKAGTFGKIQLLDNQQVRLVVGEASFELVSSHPLATTSDVVMVEQRGDEYVRLNCLGHLDQAMVAVPDLENFVRIGQSHNSVRPPDR